MEKYPEVKLHLVLSDDLLDPIQDGFDVTLRIAEQVSSSLIARKITPIERANQWKLTGADGDHWIQPS